MRIAVIGCKGIPAVAGGVERVVEQLSGELASRGHEVLVYARPWESVPPTDVFEVSFAIDGGIVPADTVSVPAGQPEEGAGS